MTITTGGYSRETAIEIAEETGQLVGFGRPFIANVSEPFPVAFRNYLHLTEHAAARSTIPFREEYSAEFCRVGDDVHPRSSRRLHDIFIL